MAWVRVPLIGSEGVNKDLSPHELPPQAWTGAENVRFLEGSVEQALGWAAIYGTTLHVPLHVRFLRAGNGTRYWVYCGAGKIGVAYNNEGVASHADLTRVSGDYSAAVNSWTSTVLSGIPIFNPGNEVDPPQTWSLNVASRCAALPNWPVGLFCRSMRAFNNRLVALNITRSGTNYPYMVKWSHPADPGAVPSSWDETDATLDAGEAELAVGGDAIVDGMPLRDSFLIYKERSIWRMDFVGGLAIFRFQQVLGSSGALNRNCIVEVDGVHVVLTRDDLIVHDGQSPRSVLDNISRRQLFNEIGAQNIGACFLAHNPYFREVLVCYPAGASTTCNRALVWNYGNRTVSFREVPAVYGADVGENDETVDASWDSDADSWESDISTWAGGAYLNNAQRLVMASNESRLHLMDGSALFGGVLPTASVERIGLSMGSPETIKRVRSVRPRISGSPGAQIQVSVGAADDPYTTPLWSSTATFTVGESMSCDVMTTGRYIGLRIVAPANSFRWRLDSLDIDVVPAGRW